MLWLAAGWLGCGGKQDPAGEGEDCYRDSDCQPGLVCVPAGDTRHCSSDTTGLVSTVETPPMEMPPGTGATGGTGAAAAGGADPGVGGANGGNDPGSGATGGTNSGATGGTDSGTGATGGTVFGSAATAGTM